MTADETDLLAALQRSLERARESRAEDTYRAAATRAKEMRKAVAGALFCSRCEFMHEYCECDDYAHLGTHSRHRPGNRPHPMGE